MFRFCSSRAKPKCDINNDYNVEYAAMNVVDRNEYDWMGYGEDDYMYDGIYSHQDEYVMAQEKVKKAT